MKLILLSFIFTIGIDLILNESCEPDKIIEQINVYMNSYANQDQKNDLHYLIKLASSSKEQLCMTNLFESKYKQVLKNVHTIAYSLANVAKSQINHKFYDIDRRIYYNENVYQNKSASYPQQFVNMFPKPPIIEENPDLAYHCKKSSWDCIYFFDSIMR